MRPFLLTILRAPKSAEPLTLHSFVAEGRGVGQEENIVEGILVARNSKKAYPIMSGVPVMLDSAFTHEFLEQHNREISKDEQLSKIRLSVQKESQWSFSSEWEYHFKADLGITWGWTVPERIQQFLLETDMDAKECYGQIILDAGCGNGGVSEGLSELGATVVAMDYSNSVLIAEGRRKAQNVHFVRGDLQAPPFGAETFDIIISNGVLHHTPDTYTTFVEVAKLVNPGGRFYNWVYRRPEEFVRRHLIFPAVDLTRTITSMMPSRVQELVVKVYALALWSLHKLLGKYKDRHCSWAERVVLAYDSITPRWKHYHTPIEVSYWYFMNGFTHGAITHWDNRHGFGMLARKVPQKDCAGPNFGKSGVVKRYWE